MLFALPFVLPLPLRGATLWLCTTRGLCQGLALHRGEESEVMGKYGRVIVEPKDVQTCSNMKHQFAA